MCQEDADLVRDYRDHLRVIVINNTYTLAPYADVLYACDAKWWGWHPDAFQFRGIKVSMTFDKGCGVFQVGNGGTPGFSQDPTHLATGRNGGYQAINLAYHLGAKNIILLGYDMRAKGNQTHWHDEHPAPTPAKIFPNFVRNYDSMLKIVASLGIRIVNASRETALPQFPRVNLEETLANLLQCSTD